MSDHAPRKFRVWDGEEMHEVPHGWYLDASGVLYRYDGTLFADSDDDRWVMLQYTGLTDAEGTEVYEGDVVRYTLRYGHEQQGEVIFRAGSWMVERTDGIYVRLNKVVADIDGECNVIGNRYENPELLQEGSNYG